MIVETLVSARSMERELLRMVDIQASHILPKVEDGSHSLEESVEMCRMSAEDGVTVMVATRTRTTDCTRRTNLIPAGKGSRLNKELSGKRRSSLAVSFGLLTLWSKQICETHSAPTIAGGPYALVSSSRDGAAGKRASTVDLMRNQITPIIAHPERNMML